MYETKLKTPYSFVDTVKPDIYFICLLQVTEKRKMFVKNALKREFLLFNKLFDRF